MGGSHAASATRPRGPGAIAIGPTGATMPAIGCSFDQTRRSASSRTNAIGRASLVGFPASATRTTRRPAAVRAPVCTSKGPGTPAKCPSRIAFAPLSAGSPSSFATRTRRASVGVTFASAKPASGKLAACIADAEGAGAASAAIETSAASVPASAAPEAASLREHAPEPSAARMTATVNERGSTLFITASYSTARARARATLSSSVRSR